MRFLGRGYVRTGIDSVRGAKLRNFWTVLGVVIGVMSVISVVSIGEGIKQQIGGQIHHQSKDLITIRPGQLETSNGQLRLLSGVSINGSLSDKDVSSVIKAKGVSLSTPFTAVSGKFSGDSESYNGLAVGTSPDLPSLLNQSLAYGDFFTADDAGTYTVVLGQKASERLFSEAVPLGRSVHFRGHDFIVRGIFNEFPTSSLSTDADYNTAIFIPYDVAEQLSNNSAPTYQILAKPVQGQSSAVVSASIRTALLKNHGGQNDFSVLQQNQNVAASSGILTLLTELITGVAAISLLVGGIGIMNVMLVSVTERMHEIGVRKAIGATNRQIWSQFLIEAVVLSLSGGLLGVGLSYAVAAILNVLTDIHPVIMWQIVVIAVGSSLVIGVVFGSVPAAKAARKDPIDALRSE